MVQCSSTDDIGGIDLCMAAAVHNFQHIALLVFLQMYRLTT